MTPATLIFPYRHWVYAGDSHPLSRPESPISFQDGSIALGVSAQREAGMLTVDLRWWTDGTATGDGVAFVHLYSDLDAPPVRQSDQRSGGGALPPGAWLPGALSDRVVLDLSGLPPGLYTLAVGLYDPVTGARLNPVLAGQDTSPSAYVVDSGRVLVEELLVSPDP
jgi:hypothetical protein